MRVTRKLKVSVSGSTVTNNDTKVMLASITNYNNNLVLKPVGDEIALQQHHCHEHMYQMMQFGELSKNSIL